MRSTAIERSTRRAGEAVALTNKEFALLEQLILNRGQCLSRVELLETVWNMEPAQTTNIVDVYVNYLRRKLKDPAPGHLIRTVRGQGYRIPTDAELALPIIPALIREQALTQTPMQNRTQPADVGPVIVSGPEIH